MEIPAYALLLDLQAVDLDIDRLLHRRASLPELEEFRQADEALKSADATRAEIAARDRVVGLDLDKAEGELEMVEAKLQEAETRLYAGGMSGKETEHKRLEVQGLRGQQEALETRVLVLIDEKEKVAEQLSLAGKTVDDLAARKAELGKVIAVVWKEIDAVLGRREASKAEMVPTVPPDLYQMYEKLRHAKEGVAISRFDHGQCGGCHLGLSPAERREAAESDPPRCVHCRRLLVF